jgi:outer membrane protein assembly factor BamE (lipoprotein component of BamABCDE complex)
MHIHRWVAGILVAGCLAAAGCYYKAPNTEHLLAKVAIGMTKDEVIEVLGQPTAILESEMFYIYDDPRNPVRLRFVLNDRGVVVAKYYESKNELAARAEEAQAEAAKAGRPPPGAEQPPYPGGPMPRFEKKGPPF